MQVSFDPFIEEIWILYSISLWGWSLNDNRQQKSDGGERSSTSLSPQNTGLLGRALTVASGGKLHPRGRPWTRSSASCPDGAGRALVCTSWHTAVRALALPGERTPHLGADRPVCGLSATVTQLVSQSFWAAASGGVLGKRCLLSWRAPGSRAWQRP